MRTFRRSVARSSVAALSLLLVACGTTAPISPSASGTGAPAPVASASASADPAAAAAYGRAICPLFERIVELDPRLAAIRAAGEEGGDMTVYEDELAAVADELRDIVNALNDVPNWGPGRRLQLEIMGTLHLIRAELLTINEDLTALDAADAMAALPYIASETMDREMARAVEGGLSCGTEE
ncbi:MAG TPA: hypothetical protein VFM03_04110 [Candidatus Limnocylindria bacterium]|jgi:hypothetical protein|nr:hypothetical protein [Candidatus Limnocylindria bacterium]